MSQQESPQPLGSRQPHRQSRPSPLSQVQTTDILSSNRNSRSATPASFAASEVRSDVAQDPLFWKRFSQAVQVAEESKAAAAAAAAPAAGKKAENRVSEYSGRGSWLQQQKREKRKCRVTCALIIGAAIAVIIALVVVLVIVVKV